MHENKGESTIQDDMLGIGKNELLSVICKYFHQNNNCKYGQQCQKSHEFILEDKEYNSVTNDFIKVKRLFFNSMLPITTTTRIKAAVWKTHPNIIYYYFINDDLLTKLYFVP